MAIKNIIARGIGFTGGAISWVITRGFGSFTGGATVVLPQSPTSVVITPSRTSVTIP